MSERIITNRSNKNILRRTAEAAALATAAALALSACTAPDDALKGPRIENVNPEEKVSPEDKAVAEFVAQFDALGVPVEVIASPLTITPRAEQRDIIFDISSNSILVDDSDSYKEDLDESLDALASIEDPVVKGEAWKVLDEEISEGVATAYKIYTHSDTDKHDERNATIVRNQRALAEEISNEELREAALSLLNLELAYAVMQHGSVSPMNQSERSVLGLLPEELQKTVTDGYGDKQKESELYAMKKAQEAAVEELTRGSYGWLEGSAWRANETNATLAGHQEYRAENTDPAIPAAKDLLLNVVEGVTLDTIDIAKRRIDAVPERFEVVQREARMAFDGAAIERLVEALDLGWHIPSTDEVRGSLEEANAYVNSLHDTNTLGLKVADLKAALIARAYANLDAPTESTAERDQLLLSELPEGEYKEFALAVRGGDRSNEYELDRAVRAAEDAVGMNVFNYSTLRDSLYQGSNRQASTINEAATDYLNANR